jgi:hypothetical protein
MKTLSKLQLVSGIAMLTVSMTLIPYVSLAASIPATSPQAKGFCANLSADESKISSNMLTHANTLASKRAEADTKLQQTRATVDAKIVTDRTQWDATRQQHFAALEAKATTPAQKQAVTTFESTVLAAVATRRATVDQARTTFRSAEDGLIASRRSSIDAALAAFKASIASAEAQAQTGCDSGVTPVSVRTTFVASMKQARVSLQSSFAGITKVAPQLQILGQTRKTAVQAADAARNVAIKQAAVILKAALHQ